VSAAKNASLGSQSEPERLEEDRAQCEGQFDQEFCVNVKGVFFAVQKALRLLVDGALRLDPNDHRKCRLQRAMQSEEQAKVA